MSRKHYEAFARELAKTPSTYRAVAASVIVKVLEEHGSGFNRERFLAAAKVTENQIRMKEGILG